MESEYPRLLNQFSLQGKDDQVGFSLFWFALQ
jgi:hypothetical protein